MSSPSSAAGFEQPPRKKMRKGTKSCIECRRRKIKCTYEENRPHLCNECFARGSTCIDQEHAESQSHPSGGEQSYSLRERVTHLESVVKGVLNRLDNAPPREVETERAAEVLKNLKTASHASNNIPENGSAPVLSLFDNAVLKRREDSTTMAVDPRLAEFGGNQSKDRKLQETLKALLPSQKDLIVIFRAADKWWQVYRRMFPELYAHPQATVEEFRTKSYMAAGPASIAKTLLCTAISLDQLAAGFDEKFLSLPFPRDQLRDKYINVVHDLVTADDDIAGTIEGIECMLLETTHYSNVGKPRKAWLTFRRALSFAELLGLQRAVPKPGKANDRAYQRRYELWCALVQGDRYLSLILGLPYSVHDHLLTPHIPKRLEDTSFPPGEYYHLHLMLISGRIIDRNQDPAHMSLSSSLKIDQELEELYDSMPANTWNLDRNPHEDVEGCLDRLMALFLHHQLRSLIHLPFMLKSAADQRYQYSKIAAIEASRAMINVYLRLRSDMGSGPYVCKVLDFQAFTGAMLLLLNLLGYAQGTPYKDAATEEKDWSLVNDIIDTLREASNEAGGVIAAQSAKALELIASSRNSTNEECDGETCKIVIPYFGTIRIGAGKNFSIPKPTQTQIPTPPNSNVGCNSSSATPTASSYLSNNPGARQQPPPSFSASSASGSATNTSYLPETDNFISFDSMWAMPPSLPEGIYDQPSSLDASSAVTSNGATPGGGVGGGYSGQDQTNIVDVWQNLNAGVELDQTWNWYGFDTSTSLFGNANGSEAGIGSIDPNLRS